MSDDQKERSAYAQAPASRLPQGVAARLVHRALAERPALLRRLIVGEVLAERLSTRGAGRQRGGRASKRPPAAVAETGLRQDEE